MAFQSDRCGRLKYIFTILPNTAFWDIYTYIYQGQNNLKQGYLEKELPHQICQNWSRIFLNCCYLHGSLNFLKQCSCRYGLVGRHYIVYHRQGMFQNLPTSLKSCTHPCNQIRTQIPNPYSPLFYQILP